MGLDKKFLSESYRRMSDGELLSLISNDYNDLTEDARDVLKTELEQRGLDKGIGKAIELQTSEITEKTLLVYTEMIRKMSCPICKNNDRRLNAVITFNSAYPEYKIACPSCLEKTINNASAENVGRGFLGGIGGIIKTANHATIYNRLLKQIKADKPSDALIEFVKKRIGEMELNKDNTDRMSKMIQYPNATIY